MGYIPEVFRTYMGVGYVAAFSLVLLLIGSWSAMRERRALLPLYGAIVPGPVLMSLQGVSLPYSATYARYLIFSLPFLLILMAEGIDWSARHVRIPGGASITALGLTTLVVLGWTPSIHTQFLAKKRFPYLRVAKFLHEQMQKDDTVVAGWSMRFTLSQFFENETVPFSPTRHLRQQNYRETRGAFGGSRLLRHRPGCLTRPQGSCQTFRANRDYALQWQHPARAPPEMARRLVASDSRAHRGALSR